MQKEIKVVLLESKTSSPIITWGVDKLRSSHFKINDQYDVLFAMASKYQHLYFTTDEEIKKGDWVIYNPTDNVGNGRIFKCLKTQENFCGIINDNIESNIVIDFCKKIIASTDTSLNLPKPQKDWVKYYIRQWNNGVKINKLTVEYENGFDETYGEVKGFFLKINTDNTIDINPPAKPKLNVCIEIDSCYGCPNNMYRHGLDEYVCKIRYGNNQFPYIIHKTVEGHMTYEDNEHIPNECPLIKPYEKTWKRKEVVELVNEAYINGIKDIGLDKHNEWIEDKGLK